MKVFLDDVRSPQDCVGYMHLRIGAENPIYLSGGWLIVRNYDEFVEVIEKYHKDITHISYDHDLAPEHYTDEMMINTEEYVKSIEGTEKTGCDCAKWMKNFYDTNGIPYPRMYVHSMNPVGTENIINIFKTNRK